ncbi:hypothetical protein M514_01572 [Trichuris suis]|uniref:Zn-finger in Ran binding protein n=1 Tax=Trichuris suis TaxID=68888 RepID=A0A085NAT0_9BILA|nr:hypothetical protein M514_01572 [Trichuris suis]
MASGNVAPTVPPAYQAMQATQPAPPGMMSSGYNYPPAYTTMNTQQGAVPSQPAQPTHTSTGSGDQSGYAAPYGYDASAVQQQQQQQYAAYMQQFYQVPPQQQQQQQPSAPPTGASSYYATQQQMQDKQQGAAMGGMQAQMLPGYGAYGTGAPQMAVNPQASQMVSPDQYRQYYGQYQQQPPQQQQPPPPPPPPPGGAHPGGPPMMRQPPPGKGQQSYGGRMPPQRHSRWDSPSGQQDDGGGRMMDSRDRSSSGYPQGRCINNETVFSIGPGKRGDVYQDQGDSGYGAKPPDNSDVNNAIFIQGIPDMADAQIVAEYFSQAGEIMIDNRGGPKVHVYKDKMSGRPKGEALVSFMNPQYATAAIDRFNGQYFPGCEVPMKVTYATTRSTDYGIRGGRDMGGGGGGGYGRGGPPGRYDGGRGRPGGYGGRGNFGGPPRGRSQGSYDRGGMSSRGVRLTGANMEARSRDWVCMHCNNANFGFRQQCNKCRAPRPEGDGGQMGGTDSDYPPPFVGNRGGPPRGGFGRGRGDYGDMRGGGGGYGRGGPPRGGRDSFGGPMRSNHGGSDRDRSRPY